MLNCVSHTILKQGKMQIILGDCLEEMRKMTDNSIDCIVTDPPYGLSFMGKKWDKEVPSVDYWKEMLRIVKPGSFLLASGAPRSHHHLAMAIENAGWEITDCIMHLFGSGFPKGKSQLKPAYEPWILARKKADKVQHLNIDDSRIESNLSSRKRKAGNEFGQSSGWNDHNNVDSFYDASKGRWPANIILGDEEVEEMLDEQSGILKSGEIKPYTSNYNAKEKGWGFSNKINCNSEANSGGASRFFYCAKASRSERNKGLEGMELKEAPQSARSKPAEGRKNALGNPRENHHPTVKPQKLMEYLIKLVMPKCEYAILLDPFLGSGSTLVAAQNLNIKAIGIEMNEEYCEIAKKRIEYAVK
jgi:site-specific DNA-methyltransferase (adenine-specific)